MKVMTSNSSCYFICAFIAITLTVVSCETCKEKAIKADKCAKRVFFIGDEMNIPRTIEQYDAYCGFGKEMFKCAKSYRQCLTKFPRQVFNVVLDSAKKALRRNCDKHVDREEILDHLKCFTVESMKPLVKCAENGLIRLEFIANYSKDENLIADVCCLSHIQVKCVTSEILKQCPQKGKQIVDFTVRMYNAYVRELMDLGCRKYSSLNECNKLNPERMVQLANITGSVEQFGDRLWIDPPLKLAARLID